MKAWSYYAVHTFINSIKKIFRTKFLVFILICVLCGVVFGVGTGFVTAMLFDDGYESLDVSEIDADHDYILLDEDDNLVEGKEIFISPLGDDSYVDSKNNYYTIVEVEDYLDRDKDNIQSRSEIAEFIHTGASLTPDNFTVYELLDDEASFNEFLGFELTEDNIYILVEAVAELVFLAFILFAIYFGCKKGCDIFLMPDVNFLFSAPMKGQSVLLFRLSFQLVGTLIGCLYLLFQIPNLLRLGISLSSILLGLLGFFIVLVVQKVINVLAYILCANNSWLKDNLQKIILGIVALIGIGCFTTYKMNGNDLLATADLLFGNNWTRYIPFFGWFKAMVVTAMRGQFLPCLVYFMLFLALFVAIFYLTWSIKADFYEEALLGAQTRDEVLQAAQEKGNAAQVKREKDRSDKIKRNMGMKGQGAAMFFHKEMYNRKRMSYFGVISKTMLTYLGFSMIPAGLMLFIIDTKSFTAIACLLAGVILFRSMGNPIETEIQNAWIWLAPQETNKKVFFSLLAGTAACALDLLPSIILSGILMQEKVYIVIGWYIALICLDLAISIVGVMMDALVPMDGLTNIKAGIIMMIRFVLAGIFYTVIGITALLANAIIGLVIASAILIVVSIVGFLVYPLKMDIGF